MKPLFYIGIAGLILFEIAQVYFIMPMPGSQRMESLHWAYNLYQRRWIFRIILYGLVLGGSISAFQASWWKVVLGIALAALVSYKVNFDMAADHMFLPPENLLMADASKNTVPLEKLVLGVNLNGQAKAYPIQFLGYHHQVLDTLGGEPVMVTYCTVCRSGRVFSPKVNGAMQQFRLVGMDHFNAMFEDQETKSWWRQATGEAVAGPLQGSNLPEIPSSQASLRQWFQLYPGSLVMQRDPGFTEEYDSLDTYDLGIRRGKLTGTDTASWHDKSWVVGVSLDQKTSRAFDWNRLKQERIISDKIGNQPMVLVLASDQLSFAAFQRADSSVEFSLKNDTIIQGPHRWDFHGRSLDPSGTNLTQLAAYQEFWHSWRHFHPYTTRY